MIDCIFGYMYINCIYYYVNIIYDKLTFERVPTFNTKLSMYNVVSVT